MISEVISFFPKYDLGDFFSEVRSQDTTRRGITQNRKTQKPPLPGAEFRIWPLKSALEVTYFRYKFISEVGHLRSRLWAKF